MSSCKFCFLLCFLPLEKRKPQKKKYGGPTEETHTSTSPSHNHFPPLLPHLPQSLHHNLQSQTTLTKTQIPQTTPPPEPFTFIIKVLAFNRLPSLSRCLRSLSAAHYPQRDTVHLHLYLDHPTEPSSLNQSLRILDFVDSFYWPHGNKIIHYRTSNVGLQAQWLEAWWPTSDHEFAFVVEDDLEVSPLYYKFVKEVISNYYYNASNFSPSLYGVSLQRPRFVPGKHGNKINLDNGTHLFLYQLVGTWGQILFPRPWKEFRLWYDEHKTRGIKPLIDGMVTTGWYKKKGEKIWTPWFIKFIHERGYFNIYTNFQHERALSVSHRDAGVNYGKSAGPDSQLLGEGSLDCDLLDMQPLNRMKWYDFCFREVIPDRVARSLDDLGSVLTSVQKQHTILLVSILEASDLLIKNLLCHFERLNIQNYVLMGSSSDYLLDLARRGHAVIDATKLLNDIRKQRVIVSEGSSTELMKDILVKAYVIKKCLEYGYNSWIVDSNMLFTSNDPIDKNFHPTSDFYAGTSLEIFFVRGSSSAQRTWTNGFLKKIAATLGQRLVPSESQSFVHIVVQLLEQNSAQIYRVDETGFGMKIDDGNASQSSSLEIGKKMVYWSAGLSCDVIQKRLEELSLWTIDGDSSCKAVVCHPS